QAEDGIRDFHVTGVQTCALPIYTRMKAMRSRWLGSMFAWILNTTPVIRGSVAATMRLSALRLAGGGAWATSASSRSRTPKFLSRSEERRVGKEGRTRGGRGTMRR